MLSCFKQRETILTESVYELAPFFFTFWILQKCLKAATDQPIFMKFDWSQSDLTLNITAKFHKNL